MSIRQRPVKDIGDGSTVVISTNHLKLLETSISIRLTL